MEDYQITSDKSLVWRVLRISLMKLGLIIDKHRVLLNSRRLIVKDLNETGRSWMRLLDHAVGLPTIQNISHKLEVLSLI